MVRTTIALTGMSPYLSGRYTTDVYLAPNVGIIKMVGKNPSGDTLYTMELTGSSELASAKPKITKVEPGTFKIGEAVTLTITGENLAGVTGLEFGFPALTYTVTDLRASANTVTARVTARAGSQPLNPIVFVTVWVVSPAGASNSETLTLTR